MTRWRGEPGSKRIEAIDAYGSSAAEHGRLKRLDVHRTSDRVDGADSRRGAVGAIGAMSGPLHGGALARRSADDRRGREVRRCTRPGQGTSLDRKGEADGLRRTARRTWRARVPRETARTTGGARSRGRCASLEQAALAELRERRPDRAIETNVERAAVILDYAGCPRR